MYFNKDDLILINEEQRAVKWFLILFYFIYIFYEVFYHVFYKKIVINLPQNINYWMYFCLLILLPIALLLVRNHKIYFIKYVFVVSYIVFSIINETLIYQDSSHEYKSGNAVEVMLLLFSPMFINTRFFWVVTGGLISKYLFIGLLLQSNQAFFPIPLVIIFAGIAFILLKRFQGYVKAVKTTYNKQLQGIVKGVIATIELKDPYTRGHSERVAYYAKLLAKATRRFTKVDLEDFHNSCLLHDIGKVNIPDSILMKPGRLSKDEFELIKTHPVVGADAIKKVCGLGESIDVIQSHHERWDGNGYPKQLKGNQIPYLARVVSIADAFDAMTSSRSYREALSVEVAYERIIEGAGTQFDPDLVEVFKQVYPEWVAFHRNYPSNNKLPFQNETFRQEVLE
ncbi:metal-dependent phosphohydrolase [Bacillus sp. T33-2]|nr:metal-dependent phosphohydrolase [Bacillus sp. T33-2]